MTTRRTREQIEETSRLGMQFYNDRVRPLLTDDDDGRFIAIDIKTGEYEIGDNEDVGLVLE